VKIEKKDLDPGLYFVATPIGAARDITLRALDILASADVLAAEDTRTLRRLMQIHGIALGERQILAYHDHNGARMRPKLIGLMQEGRSVAYASDAGTPLVADPGFPLAREALAEGLAVTSAPGPSAVMAALSVAGLPTDRFLFAGFPPAAKGARASWMAELLAVPATLVLYETPRRIARFLTELAELGAGDRAGAVCRELTKRFEEVRRGSIAELAEQVATESLKGEIVVVIDRDRAAQSDLGVEEALLGKRLELSLKDAVKEVALEFGLPRREVYQRALALDAEHKTQEDHT
jgi:16S rRNA (cytidine1402-2'-O)-methyltransferase